MCKLDFCAKYIKGYYCYEGGSFLEHYVEKAWDLGSKRYDKNVSEFHFSSLKLGCGFKNYLEYLHINNGWLKIYPFRKEPK